MSINILAKVCVDEHIHGHWLLKCSQITEEARNAGLLGPLERPYKWALLEQKGLVLCLTTLEGQELAKVLVDDEDWDWRHEAMLDPERVMVPLAMLN